MGAVDVSLWSRANLFWFLQPAEVGPVGWSLWHFPSEVWWRAGSHDGQPRLRNGKPRSIFVSPYNHRKPFSSLARAAVIHPLFPWAEKVGLSGWTSGRVHGWVREEDGTLQSARPANPTPATKRVVDVSQSTSYQTSQTQEQSGAVWWRRKCQNRMSQRKK